VPEGVGLGFDVHRRDPGRPLWLGAVHFEDEPGLAGHSDGDVVCHAVADALLGAAALGDVGEHFPESDPATTGIAGQAVLERSVELVARRGLVPASLDVTVVCDRPQVGPRRDEMRARLAEIAGLPLDRVSVKATRPEGLGLSGDGVGCLAIALVR
jgi:2-C-methyl-D-erythritol 4-phosphate cytidylyltransferase/2-C-methyl-D-erythritol 2,4-cyclodiphosphate synthase